MGALRHDALLSGLLYGTFGFTAALRLQCTLSAKCGEHSAMRHTQSTDTLHSAAAALHKCNLDRCAHMACAKCILKQVFCHRHATRYLTT